MATLQKLPTRHPDVPFRAVPLTERQAELQVQRGLYVVQEGVRLAIPVDHIRRATVFLSRDLWRQDGQGRVFRPGVRMRPPRFTVQATALAWLRDHVNENIPYWYYLATLGHDLHISTWGDLYARHFHAGWANPFEPDKVDLPLDQAFKTCPWLKDASLAGFIEECGWLSGGKVTTAFRDKEVDELVSQLEYGDFDFHEVGLSTQVESNGDTALITSSGIARATGTPTDAGAIYRTVGTITADTTETWQEHGVFCNATGPTLMDRSLTGGQSVNNLDQVEYTYELTKNAEA